MSFWGKEKTFTRTEDKVWQSRDAKLLGLSEDVKALSHEGTVLVLAHFARTAEEIVDTLRAKGLSCAANPSHLQLTSIGQGQGTGVYVARVADLRLPWVPSFEEPARLEKTLTIVVAEYHPMIEMDQTLLEWARNLPLIVTLSYHESLDSPMFKPFGVEQIRALLTKLNVAEDDFISHSFVTRAIENAHHKISRHATGNIDADSIEEWFERNYPK